MEEASPISACLSPLSATVNGSCSTHCSSSFLTSSLVPHLHSNRTPHHNKASPITSGLQDNRTQPEHCESNSGKEIISQERKEASDFAFARQATHSLQAQDGKSLSSTTEDCSVSSTFSSFEAHPLCGQTDSSNHSVFSDTSSHTSASSAGSCSSREEAHSWNCSVCTYRNPSDAFKCHMCDVRKGISTRKPRVNPEVLAQQVARQQQQIQAAARKACAKQAEKSQRSPSSTSKRTEAEQFESPKQKRKTKEMKTEPVKESEARGSKENGETSNINNSKENGNTLVARSSKENGNGQDSSNLFDGLSRDRSETITVNNVTVRITEYLPRTHMESAKSNGKVKNKSKS